MTLSHGGKEGDLSSNPVRADEVLEGEGEGDTSSRLGTEPIALLVAASVRLSLS